MAQQNRYEPEASGIDGKGVAFSSIAISLKRIADMMEAKFKWDRPTAYKKYLESKEKK